MEFAKTIPLVNAVSPVDAMPLADALSLVDKGANTAPRLTRPNTVLEGLLDADAGSGH